MRCMTKKLIAESINNDAADLSRPMHTNYESHVIPDLAYPYKFHFKHLLCMPHWHENIEILQFSGRGSVVCDRMSYDVKEGDIAVISSNMLHSVPACGDTTHDCLIIDNEFLVKNNINIAGLKFECIIRDEVISELFCDVMAEVVRAYKGDEYSSPAVKAAILTLMVRLCRNYSVTEEREYGRNDAIKRALGYIKAHYSEPLTVDMIAGKVNISKYYFCREFRRETGFTVVRYINNLRCREAEKLLRAGKYTVGEVARVCGFENLSYFTRTYKAIIGVTPSHTKA